jgi:hypothetical protein
MNVEVGVTVTKPSPKAAAEPDAAEPDAAEISLAEQLRITRNSRLAAELLLEQERTRTAEADRALVIAERKARAGITLSSRKKPGQSRRASTNSNAVTLYEPYVGTLENTWVRSDDPYQALDDDEPEDGQSGFALKSPRTTLIDAPAPAHARPTNDTPLVHKTEVKPASVKYEKLRNKYVKAYNAYLTNSDLDSSQRMYLKDYIQNTINRILQMNDVSEDIKREYSRELSKLQRRK